MDIVDPRVDPALLPEGSFPRVMNSADKSCLDLPAIITPSGTVVTRWQPTDEERARIAAGEDLFLTIMGVPIRPVHLAVGPSDWTEL